MDEKVQLSRETIVGDDVVNEDIYPNTNTKSVNDDQSGTSLNDTIERIWAAINNKLSRVVNSVNGRSGVVVLDSSDVGLENVDNVSFNDIKSWVLDELSKVFDYKKIKLFSNKSALDMCIRENNMNDLFAPFYVENWGEPNDVRPHIGCIILDPSDSSRLACTHMSIPGIGSTDDSLSYKNNNADDATLRPAGDLRVKISSHEDALYVSTEGTAEERGLLIDKNAIGGVFHFYDGIYGTPVPDPERPSSWIYENGLLSTDTHGTHPVCRIFIDGNEIDGQYYLEDESIHQDDTIVCNFFDYRGYGISTKSILNSEYLYMPLEAVPGNEGEIDWSNSGDGYRVGDILDIADVDYVAKFIVTGIKDGMYEGPVASVNLLYCEPVTGTGFTGFYETKPIIRYMNPVDTIGYPDPVDPGTGDNYISLNKTSSASGCKIYIDSTDSWVRAPGGTPSGMDFKLMLRGMCIGCVKSAPTRLQPTLPYIIELNSVRPLVGNSLQFKKYDEQFHADKISDVVDIRTRRGHFNNYGLWNKSLDVSGLSVAENWGEYREDGKPARIVDGTGDTMVEPNRMNRTAVLPGGIADVMPNSQSSSGGVTVMTDMSLCLIPHELCAPMSGEEANIHSSQYAVNWAAQLPYIFQTYQKDPPSYVGVNLFKVVKHRKPGRSGETVDGIFLDRKYMINLSGLRVVGRWDKLDKSMVGKTSGDAYIDTDDGAAIEANMEHYPLSGGLMVNVGKGLEIKGWYSNTESDFDEDSFVESGKVCVRVDEQTITVNDNNRLAVKIGRGLEKYTPTGTVQTEKKIGINVDNNTIGFTEDNIDAQIEVNINSEIYHDIDMMSNRHAVLNGIVCKSPIGDEVGLSMYVDTKYGLGFTISGNTTESDVGAPNALMIRIKAGDTGSADSEYRKKVVALREDGLMFDPDGRLIAPIDTSKGLENSYQIKAVSSDSRGNVIVKEVGGIGIKAGAGLTFDKDGALTLIADYEIKALKNGFDLNNLVTGTYYAKADVSDTLSNRPASDLGVFRIEHKPVIPEENYYIQKLYSFEKKGIVYIRYKTGSSWTAWYHIDGAIIN